MNQAHNQRPILARYFTNRQQLLGELQATARDPKSAARRIYWLHGGVGLGKSAILEMLRDFCEREGIPHARLHLSSADTEFAISERFVRELGGQGVSLRRLKAILDTQDAAQEEDRKRRQQVIDAVRGASLDSKSELAKMTMSPESVMRTSAADQDAHRVVLFRDLAAEFAADLKRASSKHPVVLMLDDLDRLQLEEEWRRVWFRECIRHLPANTMLVFTSTNEHLDYLSEFAVQVANRQIEPLNDEEIRALAEKYYEHVLHSGATSEKIGAIVDAAEGNPFWVPVLADQWRQVDAPRFASSATNGGIALIDQLGDSLRQALEVVSVLRVIKEDLAHQMIDDNNAIALLSQLRISPYLAHRKDMWRVRSLIRDGLCRRLSTDAPRRYRRLHGQAFRYYSTLIEERAQDGSRFDDEWQSWELERLYHQYQISTDEAQKLFQRVFEQAYYLECDYSFCWQLINEALSHGGGECVDYYLAVLVHERYAQVKDAKYLLERLLERSPIRPAVEIRALRYLATLLWFFDPKSEKDAARAKELYRQSLDLAHEKQDTTEEMVTSAWLGNLEQRTQGNGIPLYRGALKICKKLDPRCPHLQAWLEKELGDAFRLRGEFAESERSLNNSEMHWTAAGRAVDRGHAIRTRAMLYVFMGKVYEADGLFKDARELFRRCHFLRRWEEVWTTLGRGDVAMARGELNRALRLYNEALKKSRDDQFVVAVIKGQLAEVRCAQGKWKTAVKLAEESIQQRVSAGDKFGVGWARCSLGKALIGKGEYEQALRELGAGLRMMEEYGSAFGEARLRVEICRVHYRQGEINEFREAAMLMKNAGHTYRDHLAQVFWLDAFVRLREKKKPNRQDFPLLATEVGDLMCQALVHGLTYNIYLVDSLIEATDSELEMIPLSESRKVKVLDNMRLIWEDKIASLPALGEQEHKLRALVRVGKGHTVSVTDQLLELSNRRKRRR